MCMCVCVYIHTLHLEQSSDHSKYYITKSEILSVSLGSSVCSLKITSSDSNMQPVLSIMTVFPHLASL